MVHSTIKILICLFFTLNCFSQEPEKLVVSASANISATIVRPLDIKIDSINGVYLHGNIDNVYYTSTIDYTTCEKTLHFE